MGNSPDLHVGAPDQFPPGPPDHFSPGRRADTLVGALSTTVTESVRAAPTDAVVVVEAPSGMVLFSSSSPSAVVGRPLEDLADVFEMFHPDGRRYDRSEWQLARSIATGEVIVDEEFFNLATDGARLTFRCSSHPVYNRTGQLVAAVAVARDITEERSVETQLAYHASLLESVEDAVVGTDPGLRLTVWNHGAERLYGYTAEEVLGRDAREIASYPGDDARAAVDRELLETDHTRTELTARRKDGTAVEVEVVATAVRDEQGAISGYLGVHRDTTERKRAEEDLRAARERTQSILERIGDAFLALDRDWRFTYLNQTALARIRAGKGDDAITLGDLLGRSLWDLFPELAGTRVERELRRAVREGVTVAFEASLPPTGRWVALRGYPSAEGLAVYSRDIADQKLAEEEGERRATQQALVAELGLQALAGDDVDSVMGHGCAIVARVLGASPVGIAQVLPGGDLLLRAGVGWRGGSVGVGWGGAGRTSLVGYTIMMGEPVVSTDVQGDERFTISPVLRSHDPESAATVVIAGHDEPVGVLGAFSVEPRAFSQEDVGFLQAVANVVSMAVEREASAKRVIDVRDAERRRIARDLHDEALQNLTDALALATGLGSTASDGDAADRLARLVPALKRAGEQVRGAIYDLRLGADEDRPFLELLEELVDVHRSIGVGRRIELFVDGDVPTGPLGTLGTETLRIVGEALVNARRHSGAGTIRIGVHGSGGALHVDVSEAGRGFEASRRPAAGGSGIRGMRERAELLGGHLEIESAHGGGTTVRLRVPLADGDGDAGGGGGGVRILLVEDHAAVREAMAAAFEREVDIAVVEQAASMAEARERLAQVDVALVDLGLPDGDGGQLIKELRAVNPAAQAIVLSASLDRGEIARAIESGAAGALTKTVPLHEVVHAVRRVRAGQTLLPLDEVVDLLRLAGRQRDREKEDRTAIDSLTPREREVLQALADGLDSRAVAEHLHITLRTQRNHVASILAKLGVHSQLQALVFALRCGVVEVRR
jgi:PAS domain S-box-containing protein